MLLSDIYLSPRNKICTSKNKSSDDLQYRSIYCVLGPLQKLYKLHFLITIRVFDQFIKQYIKLSSYFGFYAYTCR